MPHKILLVEDDTEITKLISLHLNYNSYEVSCCSSVSEAKESYTSDQFHLVILDIGLPDGSGFDLCRFIRLNDSQTPIIMLTCQDEEADKVLALEMGADDYITKPFGILELMARIKAIIRRTQAMPTDINKVIHHADLSIDSIKRKASLKGKRLDLTMKEFDMLFLMAANPGKTFTRKELLQHVWGFAFAGYEHTVTSHINRLRIKLEDNLNNPSYILTSWGAGYRFKE